MICKRYFPGFVDVDDEERVEHRVGEAADVLKIDWVAKRIGEGAKIEINGWAVQSVYPEGKYVIAVLLEDDGKNYIGAT